MLDKASSKNMNLSIEMREAITVLGGPREGHDNRKSWLGRAATHAKITYRQAKSLYYEEARNPSSNVVERVRTALRKRDMEKLREARNAYSELTASIRRAEASLLVSDEDFHRPEIDGLREILGRTDRPVDRRVKR